MNDPDDLTAYATSLHAYFGTKDVTALRDYKLDFTRILRDPTEYAEQGADRLQPSVQDHPHLAPAVGE